MITHRNFESDCKRIAKVIQKEANDPTSDTVFWGRTSVEVSEKLVEFMEEIYQQDKKKFNKKFDNEINKHLRCCHVKFDCATCGDYGRTVYVFDVEFDD